MAASIRHLDHRGSSNSWLHVLERQEIAVESTEVAQIATDTTAPASSKTIIITSCTPETDKGKGAAEPAVAAGLDNESDSEKTADDEKLSPLIDEADKTREELNALKGEVAGFKEANKKLRDSLKSKFPSHIMSMPSSSLNLHMLACQPSQVSLLILPFKRLKPNDGDTIHGRSLKSTFQRIKWHMIWMFHSTMAAIL
uniref:Uncharacterized protein n=1 Tax=Leersia perrieri TaxID=77586 RepID=A0A0D9W2W8_9ORYZ